MLAHVCRGRPPDVSFAPSARAMAPNAARAMRKTRVRANVPIFCFVSFRRLPRVDRGRRSRVTIRLAFAVALVRSMSMSTSTDRCRHRHCRDSPSTTGRGERHWRLRRTTRRRDDATAADDEERDGRNKRTMVNAMHAKPIATNARTTTRRRRTTTRRYDAERETTSASEREGSTRARLGLTDGSHRCHDAELGLEVTLGGKSQTLAVRRRHRNSTNPW